MNAYVLLSDYLAPLEEVDRVRPLHREWLAQRQAAGQLVIAGRRVSQRGAVIIILAPSEDEATRLASLDPYVRQGLARYEIIPFEAARWGVDPPTCSAGGIDSSEVRAPSDRV